MENDFEYTETHEMLLLDSQYAIFAEKYLQENFKSNHWDLQINGGLEDLLIEAAKIGLEEHLSLTDPCNATFSNDVKILATIDLMARELWSEEIITFLNNKYQL